MNILLCDDIKEETDKLAGLLRESGSWPAVFNKEIDALDYVHSGAPVDVCFLDIIMPRMGGVALAEKLRADGFAGEIVFLSASNEYAHESYRVKAFDYLIKPPTPESVKSILTDLDNAHKKADTEGITVNTKSMTRFIRFHELSHVEVIQHKVYFRLTGGGEAQAHTTFGEIAPHLLSDGRFIQCHRSFMVNMDEIVTITDCEITLLGGARIPVSRSFPDVRAKFMQWKFRGDRK